MKNLKVQLVKIVVKFIKILHIYVAILKLCFKKFSVRYDLNHHMKTHIQMKSYQCDFCTKSYRNSGNLKRHIRDFHEKIKSYKCTTCSKSFAQESSLNTHNQMIHQNSTIFQCDICEKCFRHVVNLKQHVIATHDRISTQECHICKKRFSWNGNLQRHIKYIHNKNQAQIYPCQVCGKEFVSKQNYFNHTIKFHEGIM